LLDGIIVGSRDGNSEGLANSNSVAPYLVLTLGIEDGCKALGIDIGIEDGCKEGVAEGLGATEGAADGNWYRRLGLRMVVKKV
jgi:hypothetical protein